MLFKTAITFMIVLKALHLNMESSVINYLISEKRVIIISEC